MEVVRNDVGLITFKPTDTSFNTEKHKYKIVTNSMTVERYMAFEQWSIISASYNGTTNYFQYIKDLRKAYNTQDYAQVGKMIVDADLGLGFNKAKEHPILMLASTFVLRDDENFREYSEDFSKEKIKDWQEAGVNLLDFFYLSVAVSPILKKGYQLLTQSILTKKEK